MMVQILSESEGNILGIRATGRLTDQDYEELLIPSLETIIKRSTARPGSSAIWMRISVDWRWGLCGTTPNSFLKNKNDFEKMAVVGERRWIEA